MANIEELIEGSQKLTGIFGYWPPFHDAAILELHFLRGDVDPDAGRYVFPVLETRIHLWELRCGAEAISTRLHTLATLRFHNVDGFRMEGFNHQNAILGLSITRQERGSGPSPIFAVHFDPAFGMGATFVCGRIEVVDAAACSSEGKPVE